MRRLPFTPWLLLGLAMLLSGCGRPPSLYAQVSTPSVPVAAITVVQADAIVVDGRHVRLIDMAAPQPAPDARCVAEAVAARQARLRMVALSEGVHAVTISATGRTDDHGRVEAHVLFDGHDPTSALIDEGLAVAPGATRTDWCQPISDAAPGAMHIAMLSMAAR